MLEYPNDHGQESRTQGRSGQGRPRTSREGRPQGRRHPGPRPPKPANRAEVYTALAETTGLGKKEVTAVFSALGALSPRSWPRMAPVSSSSPAS